MKKFALVLSGGGFKGAFQIGALKYLKDNWSILNPEQNEMKFDIIAGVSVGSLNGVLTACNEFDQLEKLWLDIGNNVEEIYTSDFIDTKNQTNQLKFKINFKQIKDRFIPNVDLNIPLGKALRLMLSKNKRKEFIDELLHDVEKDFTANFKNLRSIADNTPLKRRLQRLVKIDKIKDCIYKCGFVSLNSGKYYSYKHTDFKSDVDFQNAILASTAMPIVWEPVPVIRANDETIHESVDGGIINVSPLADVIHEINDDQKHNYTIVIINCNSGDIEYEDYKDANIAGIALRSLNDIAITEIFNNDITEFVRINDLIAQVKKINPTGELYNFNLKHGRTAQILRPFETIIIQTDTGVLGDPLVSNKNLNTKRIEHGELKAREALQQYLNLGDGMKMVAV